MTPHCTCHIKGKFLSCNKHTNFKETEVDKDGICLKCGHYCIYTSKYEIFPRPELGDNGKGYIHGHRPIYRAKETWTRKKYPRKLRKIVLYGERYLYNTPGQGAIRRMIEFRCNKKGEV